jgi:transcriptional/translational regulatory protein YebC/TACO1
VGVANRLVRLIDALEDNEDVQEVFSNEDFSDEVQSQLEA